MLAWGCAAKNRDCEHAACLAAACTAVKSVVDNRLSQIRRVLRDDIVCWQAPTCAAATALLVASAPAMPLAHRRSKCAASMARQRLNTQDVGVFRRDGHDSDEPLGLLSLRPNSSSRGNYGGAVV